MITIFKSVGSTYNSVEYKNHKIFNFYMNFVYCGWALGGMKDKKKKRIYGESNNDIIAAIAIGVVAMVIMVVMIVYNSKEKDTTSEREFEGTISYEEVEQQTEHHDELWIPEEERIYDGVLVNKYKEEFISYSEEDCMADYVYKTLDQFIDLDTDVHFLDTIRESRGAFLNVMDFGDGYKAIFELEHDSSDASKWYIKAYDNKSADRSYYVITNVKKDRSEREYNTTVEKVDWADISEKVTKFNEEDPIRLDDRAYCEELVEYYKSQGVDAWEGYDGELTVDMMMEIQGYTDRAVEETETLTE